MKYGEFDVYIDGNAAGKLVIQKSGLLTSFDCTAQSNTACVMRLAADIGNRYEIIGVMMPDGDILRLKKYFTKNDLYIKQLDSARQYVIIDSDAQYPEEEQRSVEETANESVQALSTPQDEETAIQEPASDLPLWRHCQNPEKLFSDTEAGNAVAGFEGILTSEKDGITFVAVPVDPEKPFPAMPVFFFGSQGTLNGVEYLVFRLKDGQIQV